MGKQHDLILKISQLAILIALEIIIAFTPLGSIPIGPIVATTAHIPVIIAAFILGPLGGGILGFVFGLLSLIVMTIYPSATSFVFTPFYGIGNGWSLVICFLPRILLGVVSGYMSKLFTKYSRNNFQLTISYILSAIISTLIHSILVLGMIYIFFGKDYAAANNIAYDALLAALGMVILTNTLLEAALAAIISPAVAIPINKIFKQKSNHWLLFILK